jgi:hypothetical protein
VSNSSGSRSSVSTTNSPASDSPTTAVSGVVRYRARTRGISSVRMKARKAAEPPTRGAIRRSRGSSVGPVMSRRRSVFSIPTSRNGRIVAFPTDTCSSPATWRKSSPMPPSGM